MIISLSGIDFEDGVSLPLSFLQSANAFNQTLFVNTQGRRTVDSERGFWLYGVNKADGLLSYKDKNDVATSYQAFAASGTFTVPAGVTVIRVIVCGAGGSSGNTTNNTQPDGTIISTNPGGAGGYGGLVYSKLSVTPDAVYTVTVGAAVTNGSGGSSSFSNFTATGGSVGGNGGGIGASGIGTGPGAIFTGDVSQWVTLFESYFDHRVISTFDAYNMTQKRTQARQQTATNIAVPWTFAGSLCPGARGGQGDRRAGVGGAVIVFWS